LGSVIEHELGGVQEGPDEVFIRLSVGGWLGDEFVEASEFFTRGLAGKAADEEVFDDFGGRGFVFNEVVECAAAMEAGLDGVADGKMQRLGDGGGGFGLGGGDAAAGAAAHAFENVIAEVWPLGAAGGAWVVVDGAGALGEA